MKKKFPSTDCCMPDYVFYKFYSRQEQQGNSEKPNWNEGLKQKEI